LNTIIFKTWQLREICGEGHRFSYIIAKFAISFVVNCFLAHFHVVFFFGLFVSIAMETKRRARNVEISPLLQSYLAKKLCCLKVVQQKGNTQTLLAFDELLLSIFSPIPQHENCAQVVKVTANVQMGNTTCSDQVQVREIKTRDCVIKSKNVELLEQLVVTAHRTRLAYGCTNTRVRNWHFGEIVGLLEFFLWEFQTATNTLPPCMQSTSVHVEEIISFPDGGCSCLHIFYPPTLLSDAARTLLRSYPILLISPSLTSTHAAYYKLIEHYVVGKQWTVVVTNRRGLCCTLRTPLFCVMGNDEDMCAMIRHIQEMPLLKDRKIFGLGVSVGGNALARYCAKYTSGPDQDKILAVATISSPLNLSDINCKSSAVQHALLNSLKAIYLKGRNQHVFEGATSDVQSIYHRLLRCQSLAQFAYQQLLFRYELGPNGDIFDPLAVSYRNEHSSHNLVAGRIAKPTQSLANLAAPIQSIERNDPGSLTLWDYYDTYNADKYLQGLQIPLVCLIAADDPLIRHSIPTRANILACEKVAWIQTEAGSHVLFQDDLLKTNTDLTWAECFIETYFDNLLGKILP
jgi:predicted alpha/beta-fold hydrolase